MAVRRKTNPAESVQPGDFGGSCADVEVSSAVERKWCCRLAGNTTGATCYKVCALVMRIAPAL